MPARSATDVEQPDRRRPRRRADLLLKLTTGLDCRAAAAPRRVVPPARRLAAASRHHILFVFACRSCSNLYVAWAVKASFGKRLPTLRVTR